MRVESIDALFFDEAICGFARYFKDYAEGNIEVANLCWSSATVARSFDQLDKTNSPSRLRVGSTLIAAGHDSEEFRVPGFRFRLQSATSDVSRLVRHAVLSHKPTALSFYAPFFQPGFSPERRIRKTL